MGGGVSLTRLRRTRVFPRFRAPAPRALASRVDPSPFSRYLLVRMPDRPSTRSLNDSEIPRAFSGDSPVTPALVKQHKLTDDEYASRRTSPRPRADVHRARRLQRDVERALLVQVVARPPSPPADEGAARHPGARARTRASSTSATASPPSSRWSRTTTRASSSPTRARPPGVGGILRDVFTMGARPIASLELASLRAARPPAHARAPARRRRRASAATATASASRRSAASSSSTARYDGNILVNAFTCGVARSRPHLLRTRDRASATPSSTSAPRPGATASTAPRWRATSSAKGGPSPAPDDAGRRPVHGQAPARGLPRALPGGRARGHPGHGRGRAHLVERGDGGARGQRDRARPRLRAAPREDDDALRNPPERIAGADAARRQAGEGRRASWRSAASGSSTAAVIGQVTDTKRWVIKATPGYDPLDDAPSTTCPVVVCDLPIGVLTDEAPVLRPTARSGCAAARAPARRRAIPVAGGPAGRAARAPRRRRTSARGGGSTGSTTTSCAAARVVRPGSDAGVVRVPCESDGRDASRSFSRSPSTATAGTSSSTPFEGGGHGRRRGVSQPRLRRAPSRSGSPTASTSATPSGRRSCDQFARAIDGHGRGVQRASASPS